MHIPQFPPCLNTWEKKEKRDISWAEISLSVMQNHVEYCLKLRPIRPTWLKIISRITLITKPNLLHLLETNWKSYHFSLQHTRLHIPQKICWAHLRGSRPYLDHVCQNVLNNNIIVNTCWGYYNPWNSLNQIIANMFLCYTVEWKYNIIQALRLLLYFEYIALVAMLCLN